MDVVFFKSAAELRAWLDEHHADVKELWVGFYKKATGRPSVTYREALDEALCYGWIDGVRRSVDADSYTNRFTPRSSRSNWSAVNIKRVGELATAGRMHSSGLAALEARDPARPEQYSYERESAAFDAESEARFRANRAAWEYLQAQAPWYRRVATWWVISAKKEETRLRRLAALIEDSANGRRLAAFSRPPKA